MSRFGLSVVAVCIVVILATGLTAFAGGQFTVTNDSTSMVLSPVVDSKSLPAISNREPSTVYAAGEIRKISHIPYIVRFAGETSSLPTTNLTHAPVMADGAVTWIRCRLGVRMGFCVQWISGGDATLYVNGGPVLLGATNLQAVSLGPEYRGPVFVRAVGGDSTLNVSDW